MAPIKRAEPLSNLDQGGITSIHLQHLTLVCHISISMGGGIAMKLSQG